jgi:predicted nucleic acid-binding protein
MQPVLLDSSIYISALREGEQALLALRQLAPKEPLWLSSVVLEELYAGVNARDRRVVERLERDFDRAYERIGQARLTNDALIAMSAARQGITVITANERDFARLARFRPFRWEVKSPRTT